MMDRNFANLQNAIVGQMLNTKPEPDPDEQALVCDNCGDEVTRLRRPDRLSKERWCDTCIEYKG
jgi:predicted RNA-binding Zn-ribbon protein involved in translation (DUF1610 family)